jgi:hypothetical protein
MSLRKLTAVMAAGFLLTACSANDSPSPGVAAIGGSSSSAASAPATGTQFERMLAYSECMRRNGVPGFPDPQPADGGGARINIGEGAGIDPNSPGFKAAQSACAALAPAGNDSANAFDPTKVSGWTACIRSHGIPNFPDPVNTGTGLQLDLSGINVPQQTIQSAITACRDKSPGGSMMVKGIGGGR